MATPSIRPLVVLVLAMLITIGCSPAPTSSGDLDVRTGCSLVVATRTNVAEQVVMDVHASDCRDPDGLLLARDAAVDRVAQAVWRSLELPVDAVRVTIADTAASRPAATATITGGVLAERFGRGPYGVVWPVSESPDERIWVLLPIAYLAAGLVMLQVVRRLRRAGVVVVLLRR